MLGLDQNIETFPIHLVKLDEQIRLAWVACELNFSPDAPLAESGPELINRSMTSRRGQLRWLAADRLGPPEQRQEIGRASCGERECQYGKLPVVGGQQIKK